MDNFGTDSSWQDEPIGSYPFKAGDLFENGHGPHLYYYRVLEVNSCGEIEDRKMIGYVMWANSNPINYICSIDIEL